MPWPGRGPGPRPRGSQGPGTRIPKFDNGRIIGSMSTFTIGRECSMQLAILEMGHLTLNKNRQRRIVKVAKAN